LAELLLTRAVIVGSWRDVEADEPTKSVPPAYTADTLWARPDAKWYAMVATPESSDAAPTGLPSTAKLTVPVGVVDAGATGSTVATSDVVLTVTVVVPDALPTGITCCTVGAAACWSSPAWSASTTHDPACRKVTVEPDTVHAAALVPAPAVVASTEKTTALPELPPEADTTYVRPTLGAAGGADVNVTAWLSGVTVSVAEPVVAVPAELLKAARYFVPSIESVVAGTTSVIDVAAGTATQAALSPAQLDALAGHDCHCTLGVGYPDAPAVNVALLAASTVASAGPAVTDGARVIVKTSVALTLLLIAALTVGVPPKVSP
jgi:hypothetical protein